MSEVEIIGGAVAALIGVVWFFLRRSGGFTQEDRERAKDDRSAIIETLNRMERDNLIAHLKIAELLERLIDK